MSVQPIPAGYHSITPYLIIKGAAEALEFYKKAFDAVVIMRMDGPNGRLGHAEIKIGNSPIMLSDEWPDMGYLGPEPGKFPPISLMIYVKDCDATFKQAIAAGAKELRPLTNQFYGDRSGALQDPYGHAWSIATHIEDVPPAEIERRFAEMMQKGGAC